MKKVLLSLAFVGIFAFSGSAQCDLLRGPVVINEFVAFNTNVATNAIGVHHDYVELYNTSTESFNLQGYFLSDSRGSNGRTKFQFPNVSIPGNGFLIVWCDGEGDPFLPGLNAAFNLSSTNGELVVLSNPDSVIVDFVRFAPVEENVAIGRFPNGTGAFTTMPPSYNGPNFTGDSFNVVINEYMATNSETATDPFGEADDWIELYNNSNSPVNLSGYFLSDNHNSPTKYSFPNGTILGGNQYMIIWADNQPEQGPMHAAFALSASGEEVIISRPDTSTVDFFAFGQQTTDVSEGRFPNGLGNLIPCMAPSFASENLGTISVEDAIIPRNEFMLYPNPAVSWVSFENPGNTPQIVHITDQVGRVVMQIEVGPGLQNISIENLRQGVYIATAPWGTARLVKIN